MRHKKYIFVFLAIFLFLGCNDAAMIAYYKAVEAREKRVPQPFITMTSKDGTTIKVADFRTLPPIKPPKTFWENTERFFTSLVYIGSTAWMQHENGKTQRAMFDAFGSSRNGGDGAVIGSYNTQSDVDGMTYQDGYHIGGDAGFGESRVSGGGAIVGNDYLPYQYDNHITNPAVVVRPEVYEVTNTEIEVVRPEIVYPIVHETSCPTCPL